MFALHHSKVVTITLSLALPLILVGLLLLGLPAGLTAIAEAREAGPPPPAPAVDALSPQLQSTVGATFTYQGRLLQGSDAVSGTCNLTFKLFDSLSGGSQVGSDFTNSSIAVQDGYFTQALNFGDTAFDGEARWLEITINSCNGGGSSATLSPRVALQAAPYALYALNGPWGSDYWSLNGNSGTGSDDFLGTTDNMTLTLKVSDTTSLRLVPGGAGGNGTPNVIGGSVDNVIDPGIVGGVIGGGGNGSYPNHIMANYATVGGGDANIASDSRATVGGGYSNVASGTSATVGGGYSNVASGSYATVGGGYYNVASGSRATMGGGFYNVASGNYNATVGGGFYNVASGNTATVGGGYYNVASGNYATVGGGERNVASSHHAAMGGGESNEASGNWATVGGGRSNVITGTAGYAAIGGGRGNVITGTANYANISGGYQNEASGDSATVPGGRAAQASHYGEMAYAAGQFAATGDAQTSVYVLRNVTTSSAPTATLYLDGAGELLTIANNRVVTFDILVVAARTSGGNSAGYHYSGVVENIGGTTSLLGVTSLMEYEDVDWDVAVEADDTNDALVINVTGPNNEVRWVATVRTVEVGF